MNKESIKLDNNTYAVINETGDTRIVSTINSNDEETIKKILQKENDIEELEKKLKKYKEQLNSIAFDSIGANMLEMIPIPILILSIIIIKPTTIIDFTPIAVTGICTLPIIKLFSIGMFNTRKKRKKLKQEAEYEIPNLEQIIENNKKELEKIKEESIFTELTNTHELTSNSSEHKYVYKYNSNQQNIESLKKEEKSKEIHVLKLTK